MKTRHFQMMSTLAVGLAMTCVMTTSCSVEDNPVDDGVVIENENGKEALDLGGGTPMVGAQSGYIYAAKVLGCTKKSDIQKLISKYQDEGWQIIDKDLNADARGKYIYLAVKKCDLNSAEQGSAVTDFLLTDEYQDFLDKDGKRYVNVPFDGDSNSKWYGKPTESVGVSMSIPIYSRGQTKANVKKSRIALEQAQLDYEQSALAVRQSVVQAYRNVVSAFNAYKVSQVKENAYSKSFNAYNIQYQYGTITTVELLQQQNAYLNVLNTYIQNKYSLVMKRKILDIYMGKPIEL